ncbi:MAG TPA: 16S rRNA processing protein RimM [Firmicutes bacterium]|nr:16S rRNA processing protein RimM [Bacillota bacterium]
MWRSMKETSWIVIGEIVSTQGNRGEVKIIPHTEFPERFFTMESVRLFEEDSQEPYGVFGLEGSRAHKEAVILKLEGIDTISEAEQLRKMLIKVSVDELMPLPPGRHYIFQIIGLECKTTSGEKLGVITDVLQTGANDVYVIRPYPGVTKLKEILIPVIPQVVLKINLDDGYVLVELLEGLLD